MSSTAKRLNDPIYIGDGLTNETTAVDQVEITVEGTVIKANIKDGTSVLDILLSNGKKPPHSCKAGVCMACIAVVESGTVTQDEQGSLSAKDLSDRKILACQAVPVSKRLKIRFLG